MKKRFLSLALVLGMLASCLTFSLPVSAEDITFTQDFESISSLADSGLTFSGNGGTTELVTENGNKKLKAIFPGSNGANSIHVDYEFPDAVTKGVIEVSYKVDEFNGNDAAASRTFLQFFSGDTGLGTVLEATDGWYDYPGRVKGSAPVVNAETGMYHLRAVLYRESESEKWLLTAYDDGGAIPVIRSTQELTAESVDAVRILGTWPYIGGSTLNIDDIKVTIASGLTEVEPSDDFRQDFNNLTEGTISAPNFLNTGLVVTGHASNGIGDLTVRSDGGNKYMHLHAYGAYAVHKPVYIDYYTTAPIKKGALTASMKVGFESFTAYCGARHMFNFINGSEKSKAILNTMDPYWIPGGLGAPVAANPSVNSETGMYHLRAVISRESEDEDWTVTLYDDGGATPVVVLSGSVSKDNLSAITQIKLLEIFPDTDIAMLLDDVAVTYSAGGIQEPSSPGITEDNYFVNEDFTGDAYTSILNTAQTAAAMQSINSKLSYVPADSGSFTVKEAASGKRYISVQGTGAATGYGIATEFSDVQTGNVIVEEKILLADEPKAGIDYKIGILNGAMTLGSTESNQIESMNNGNNIFGYGTGTAGTKKYAFSKDDDGFAHIKWVLSRKAINENWMLNIYDGATGEWMDGISVPRVDPGNNSGKFIDAVRKVTFVNSWALGAAAPTLNTTDLKVYQPKDVTLTEAVAYSNTTQSVTFDVSEDLEVESLRSYNVALNDANGNAVGISDMTYSAGQLTIKTLEPIEAAGTCTLNLDKVRSYRKANLFTTITFEAPGYVVIPALRIRDISAPAGALAKTQAAIRVTFNNEVDPETLPAVSFTKADGTAIKGFCEKTVDGNVLTISFGNLEAGDYKLNLETSLADLSGLTLDEPACYEYTVTDAKDLEVDYTTEDFAEGSYTAAQLAAKTPKLTYQPQGQHKILDIGTGKALQFSVPAAYQGAGAEWELPEPIATGIVTVDLEMTASDGFLYRNLFGLTPETENTIPLLQMTTPAGGLELSGNAAVVAGTMLKAATMASDGYFNLRFTVSRIKDSDPWTGTLYDLNNMESTVYTVSIPADRMSRMKSISPIALYAMGATEENFSIRRLSGSVAKYPSVANSDAEGVAPDVETLQFNLNDDAKNVTVKIQKDGDEDAVIRTNSRYDAAKRAIKVTLDSYLEYGTSYTVTFGDSGIAPYTFTTQAPSLAVETAAVSYKTAGGAIMQSVPAVGFTAHLDVALERIGNTNEVLVILVTYDESGAMTGIATDTIGAAETSGRASISNLTQAKAHTVSYYVWEKTADGYQTVDR